MHGSVNAPEVVILDWLSRVGGKAADLQRAAEVPVESESDGGNDVRTRISVTGMWAGLIPNRPRSHPGDPLEDSSKHTVVLCAAAVCD